MKNHIPAVVLVAIIFWSFTGCTNSSGPVNPTDPDLREPASMSNAPVLWGIWDVRLNESGEFEAVPMRHANFTLNAVGWLNITPGNLDPETLFVPYTTPPLVPGATNPENAARAREFAGWLTGEYLEGEGNLEAYDVFNVLAGDDPESGDFNCLRYEYQNNPGDSHPNALGNQTVAQDFTDWLVDVVWN